MTHAIAFLETETGASAIDWAFLSAGLLALGITIASNLYAAAMQLAG